MSIYQAIVWSIITALSFYIPFKAYADRVICKAKIADSWPPLLISYLIWYIPILIMLWGLVVFEQIPICAILTIIAMLWAYMGHIRVKKLVQKNE